MKIEMKAETGDYLFISGNFNIENIREDSFLLKLPFGHKKIQEGNLEKTIGISPMVEIKIKDLKIIKITSEYEEY